MERKCIYETLKSGFENVVSVEPNDHKQILLLRKRIDSMAATISKKIPIAVDIEKEKRVQHEVDNGHQPWRLEPAGVAHAALSGENISVPFAKCKLQAEANRKAIVKCTDSKTCAVVLKQLIRAQGIWTATEIEIEE